VAGAPRGGPQTREQRCWVHKVANVLAASPNSVQAGARRARNEIAQAEDRVHAERAIQSTFSPVRATTRVTKGPGNKQAGLAMVFKLLEAAEQRWRAVNGPHLVALVRAGARFEKGRLVERSKEAPEEETNKVAA
jgi:putative transposase